MPPYARRVDRPHKAITEALRKSGWLVADTSRLKGWCDLVAYKPGQGVKLIEVKTPTGTLTAKQIALRADGWPIYIVRSVEDAVQL